MGLKTILCLASGRAWLSNCKARYIDRLEETNSRIACLHTDRSEIHLDISKHFLRGVRSGKEYDYDILCGTLDREIAP